MSVINTGFTWDFYRNLIKQKNIDDAYIIYDKTITSYSPNKSTFYHPVYIKRTTRQEATLIARYQVSSL